METRSGDETNRRGIALPAPLRVSPVSRRQHAHIDPQTTVIANALNIAICNTLSSLACNANDNSPISSRNRVPLSAISNFPLRLLIAPVNAPFTCPNDSLSATLSGSAAQLRSTSGFTAVARLHESLSPPAPYRFRLTADQERGIGRRHNLNLFFQLRHARDSRSSASVHRFKRRGIAWHHILAFQLFNQQRIA